MTKTQLSDKQIEFIKKYIEIDNNEDNNYDIDIDTLKYNGTIIKKNLNNSTVNSSEIYCLKCIEIIDFDGYHDLEKLLKHLKEKHNIE